MRLSIPARWSTFPAIWPGWWHLPPLRATHPATWSSFPSLDKMRARLNWLIISNQINNIPINNPSPSPPVDATVQVASCLPACLMLMLKGLSAPCLSSPATVLAALRETGGLEGEQLGRRSSSSVFARPCLFTLHAEFWFTLYALLPPKVGALGGLICRLAAVRPSGADLSTCGISPRPGR